MEVRSPWDSLPVSSRVGFWDLDGVGNDDMQSPLAVSRLD